MQEKEMAVVNVQAIDMNGEGYKRDNTQQMSTYQRFSDYEKNSQVMTKEQL